MTARLALPVALTAVLVTALTGSAQAQPTPTSEPPRVEATVVASFPAFDANQGVGVDDRHFYAVDNRHITRHSRTDGAPQLQFVGADDGPIEHLDSAAVVGRRLYTAHSNYPRSPITSSIEVFDTRTMEHLETFSFGIDRGSLTWLTRHENAWWAGFANYDRIQQGETEPYGETRNTQIVRMDDDFEVEQSWVLPQAILDRLTPMSNSGGSWGPDGLLYLSGHDLPEAYVMALPEAGSELDWVATVQLPGIEGQGIAWDGDRRRPTLWGISRDERRVLQFTVPLDAIPAPPRGFSQVRGPGEFVQD